MQMRNKEEKCSFCKSVGNVYDRLNDIGGTFYRCSNCRLIWLASEHQPKDDVRHYSEIYYDADFHGRENKQAAFDNRLPFIEKYIVDKKRILEIGSAAGDFLSILEKRGHKVTGVELSTHAALEAQRKYSFSTFNGNIFEAAFPDNTFDAVVMYHVLEHVQDPLEVLKEIRRILADGGVVIIEVPHPNGIDALLSRKLRKSIFDYPHHRFGFPKRTLKSMLLAAGFKVRTIESSPSFLLISFLKRVVIFFKMLKGNVRKGHSEPAQAQVLTKHNSISLHVRFPLFYKVFGKLFPGMRITVVAIKK